MNITHSNTIPGLFSKGVEFLAVDFNKVEAMHDRRVLAFNDLPSFAYSVIRTLMDRPDASMEEMEEFTFKRWGGMDNVHDIDESGNPSEPEYLPGVTPAYYNNGKKVSEGELRVLLQVDRCDKAIADRLFISTNTVARHFQSLFINSGISETTEYNKRNALASWARNKGIIK